MTATTRPNKEERDAAFDRALASYTTVSRTLMMKTALGTVGGNDIHRVNDALEQMQGIDPIRFNMEVHPPGGYMLIGGKLVAKTYGGRRIEGDYERVAGNLLDQWYQEDPNTVFARYMQENPPPWKVGVPPMRAEYPEYRYPQIFDGPPARRPPRHDLNPEPPVIVPDPEPRRVPWRRRLMQVFKK